MEWLNPVSVAALVTALAAVVSALKVRRTVRKSQSHSTQDIVDSDVLAQFLALTNRMTSLEHELAATRAELKATQAQLQSAVDRLEEMQKLEEYLRSSLHEKDKELTILKVTCAERQEEIERLRTRVRHLEDVLHKAGLNGDDDT